MPILIGAAVWYFDRNVAWREYLAATGAALFLAFVFNMIALGVIHSQTSDIETWSGRVDRVEHHPKWVERWIEYHSETYPCGTDSKGNTTYCTRHWTTIEYDTHHEHWEAKRNFGKYYDSIDIDYNLYLEIKGLLGNTIIDGGRQHYNHSGTLNSGDNRIYATPNTTGFIYPATINKSFKNKIKATPNLFQFSKVPTNINVFPWPNNYNWNQSGRLIGTASVLIDILKFDQLNSKVGPLKRVNLIVIGMGNKDESYGEYQQAAFLGGKKNDLVICFGGGSRTKSASWVKAFGWTEKELVKRNLETIFLTNPINDDILYLVEQEVRQNYTIKDWKKFDYIKIYPPSWVFLTYAVLMFLTQGGLYVYFHVNDHSKCDSDGIDNL